MIAFPPAKINLGLHILRKRIDGYHDIETLMVPIAWCDVLEIVPSSKKEPFSLEVRGADLGTDITGNLCYQAYMLLNEDHNLPPVDCYLQKVIPHGAGLGGGSSDAVSSLLLLNNLFALNLTQDELLSYSTRLGSDCPFFIYNKPMLATGRGDLLKEYSLSLKGYHLAVVMPSLQVSTKEAYNAVNPHSPDIEMEAALMMPVDQWKYVLVNDFEKAVFPRYPEIKEIKSTLYMQGAVYASMSGSGSAVFGLFRTKPELNELFGLFRIWTQQL